MHYLRRFSHGRGDYTTLGIALGAGLGVVGGLLFADAAIAAGMAIGAGGGLVIGAVLDAWAEHPHGPGGRHGHHAGPT